MTCREFEATVSDLACNRPMNAVLRKNANTHVSGCEGCAQRLAAQRALNSRMLEFAEATGNEHAPPRVKQQLLAALAQQKRVPAVQVATSAAVEMAPQRRAGFPRWAFAIAASILILLTITGMIWLRSSKPLQENLTGSPKPLPAPTQLRQTAEPSTIAPIVQNERAASLQTPKIRRHLPRPNRPIRNAARENEIASEYVPLTLAADQKALANGTIVRLEVPRARLVAMGFPLRIESDREMVNAEVMLGDNGVAYAIRLVRQVAEGGSRNER